MFQENLKPNIKLKFKIMKLSLEALKERAEATASNELLETISGGTENACHGVRNSSGFEDPENPNMPFPSGTKIN